MIKHTILDPVPESLIWCFWGGANICLFYSGSPGGAGDQIPQDLAPGQQKLLIPVSCHTSSCLLESDINLGFQVPSPQLHLPRCVLTRAQRTQRTEPEPVPTSTHTLPITETPKGELAPRDAGVPASQLSFSSRLLGAPHSLLQEAETIEVASRVKLGCD